MSSSSTASKSQGEAIASGREVVDSVTSGVMKQRPSPKRESVVHSAREGCSPSVTPQKPAEHPNPEACVPQSDSGIAHEEKLQTPDSGVNVAHPGQIGNTPFVIREKALDDGYNWRKYGQKNVKGNEFIRSYYRCTQCQAKKQLDCSSEGRITNTVYFGQHNHPRPHQKPPLAVGFAVSIVEGKTVEQSTNHAAGKSLGQHSQPPRHSEPSVTRELSIVPSSVDLKNMDSAHLESSRVRDGTDNDDAPDSKRQKKSKSNVAPAPVDKHAGDPRMVVQSVSDADIVEDGYRWRKYGQKLVKGNPNPRSYYRCSTPGCPVKKHVERASDDPKVVVTTYEGKHDHDMPPSRTVTPKASGSNTPPVPLTGQSGTKSEEYGNHSIDKVGHSVLSPESNADEHQNGKPSTKLDQTEGLGSNIISSHSGQEIRQSREQIEKLGAESKPNEQNNGGEQIEKLGAENKPNEQQNGGEQIEKLGSESKPNEQQNGEEQIEKLGAENKPNEEQNGFSSEKGDAADPKTSAQSCAGLDSTSTGLLNDNLRESHVVNAVAHVRPGCEGNSSEQQRSNSEPIKS